MKSLNIGYSFFGFLGDRHIKDGKEISTPDGNATYSYTIIHELQKRGNIVYSMMPDRDKEGVSLFGKYHFGAFSQNIRWNAYNNLRNIYSKHEMILPSLDILLLEWRFPIPGRNVDVDKNGPNYQPDFDMQTDLLNYYKRIRDTKIIILDLDHKLTEYDELQWEPNAIFETSLYPETKYKLRTPVYIPTIVDELLQFKTKEPDNNKELVYIGSRYERDEIIDEYIKPYAELKKNKVYFYGNWRDYPEKLKEAEERWPGIVFNNRIGSADFHKTYKDAYVVPLLGKKSYFNSGFVTARMFESVLFGSLPVGFSKHVGIEKLALKVVDGYEGLINFVDELKSTPILRDIYRKEQVSMLRPMDVKNFVDKMIEVL